MAQLLGNDYKIYVGDGQPTETFDEIRGQTSLEIDDSTDFVDTSSKSTGRIRTQRPARRNLTITVEGKFDLPDANGLERVHALAVADPTVPANFQIRKVPFSAADVILAGSFFVGGLPRSMPDQDNATYTITLTPAAIPTTDALDV